MKVMRRCYEGDTKVIRRLMHGHGRKVERQLRLQMLSKSESGAKRCMVVGMAANYCRSAGIVEKQLQGGRDSCTPEVVGIAAK